jgi:ATP-binding cassette subfamily B protein
MARNKYDVDEDLVEEFNARSVKRMLAYLRPSRRPVAFAVFLMIVASLVSLSVPMILQIAIDKAIPQKDIQMLVLLGAVVAATQVVNALCLFIRIRVMNRIGQDVIHAIRSDIFVHLQKLPFTFFDSRPHGKILIRVVNYVNSLSDLLSNGIINLIADLFSLAFIIMYMAWLDWRLTLVSLATLPVLAAVVLAMKKRQRIAWQDMSRKQSNLNAYLHESLSGAKITQSFAREPETGRIFAKLGSEWRRTWMVAVSCFFQVWPAIEIISVAGVCLVYAAGVVWLHQAITVGVLVAFVGYIWRFWAPISTIGNFYSSLVQSAAYLERIFETIDEPEAIKDKPGARELAEVKGDVAFEHVQFSYEAGLPILKGINFHARPGDTIAIVGPTGAGKTTIVNLLSRFYTPDSGRITVDGHDIQDLTIQSLRRRMGVMLQDSFLFSGTIRDNIRYGRLDATDAEVEAAAKAVCAHEFILGLHLGYDTPLNERGIRLSMGQRQLISFARALLADPAILILDEATSSVDTETERAIQKGLGSLLAGRTSFVIAHRLSTIRNATTILFVDHGMILEAGTHDELTALRGHYWQLYASMHQFHSGRAGHAAV